MAQVLLALSPLGSANSNLWVMQCPLRQSMLPPQSIIDELEPKKLKMSTITISSDDDDHHTTTTIAEKRIR
ncbi:hypothetical protein RJ641_028807 [Dillenia turbinata]|uniref:Uncharacterized protein n=1 Tax=Dillenia turbinata TaxID=194707 RepID=A0AAN8W062_9MAGN